MVDIHATPILGGSYIPDLNYSGYPILRLVQKYGTLTALESAEDIYDSNLSIIYNLI
jgi:hypothetical protein